MNKKRIIILGSTGSIGTQTLDIITHNRESFQPVLLVAKRNWKLLASQAKEFKPSAVIIGDEEYYQPLKEELRDYPVKVYAGSDMISSLTFELSADIVVTAMVGYSGLLPTIKAIESGKTIALANKETLVAGGSIIMSLTKKHGVGILPVDSEHSAIFQCLVGEDRKKLRRIFLTASGGPFRTLSKEQLKHVKVSDALAHPNWSMGKKVTIDSASMMNKGFEMIEASWLFDCNPDEIEIVVHPQSIVHSMVEFTDGSVKAQLGIPDMRIPISYALGYPERLMCEDRFLNISDFATLSFEKPDYNKFPLLGFAFDAAKKGGNMPCILNAANEKAVEAFLSNKIGFTDMPLLVEYAMQKTPFIKSPDIHDLIYSNKEALAYSDEWIENNLK